MGSHPEGFPIGFSAQFQPLTILLGFFPQPVFSSFDWLRFKHSEVVKTELYNSRCLHFLSLCHFYQKKKHLVQVLEGVSGGRAGISEKQWRNRRMPCTWINPPSPGHMQSPSVKLSVCRSNRGGQWRTDTQLVIITFDCYVKGKERKGIQSHGHPEWISGSNHSEFPIWCISRKGSPPERCAIGSLERKEPNDRAAMAPMSFTVTADEKEKPYIFKRKSYINLTASPHS